MTQIDGLVARLSNRTEIINCGNGDVRDIPDEDCVEAAAELTRLRERNAELEKERGGFEALDLLRVEAEFERDEFKARITSLEATARELREALRSIETDARQPQIQYDKNGPQWTSNHSEFYDASYFLDTCNELADACAAAITASDSVLKSEGEKDGVE